MQDFHDSRINFNFVILKQCPMITTDDRIISKLLEYYTYLYIHSGTSFQENPTCNYVGYAPDLDKTPLSR